MQFLPLPLTYQKAEGSVLRLLIYWSLQSRFGPCPALSTASRPAKHNRAALNTKHILIAQEKTHNIKIQIFSDSIQNTALPKTVLCLFQMVEGSSLATGVQDPLLVMQESGWHHLVSIQILLQSQTKGSFAIILPPLQVYCRDLIGRKFLEIKWLGRSKGRNIPKGQISKSQIFHKILD